MTKNNRNLKHASGEVTFFKYLALSLPTSTRMTKVSPLGTRSFMYSKTLFRTYNLEVYLEALEMCQESDT